jgi:hypothetical protein
MVAEAHENRTPEQIKETILSDIDKSNMAPEEKEQLKQEVEDADIEFKEETVPATAEELLKQETERYEKEFEKPDEEKVVEAEEVPEVAKEEPDPVKPLKVPDIKKLKKATELNKIVNDYLNLAKEKDLNRNEQARLKAAQETLGLLKKDKVKKTDVDITQDLETPTWVKKSNLTPTEGQKVQPDGVGTIFSREGKYKDSGNKEITYEEGEVDIETELEDGVLQEFDDVERAIANKSWKYQWFLDEVLKGDNQLKIAIAEPGKGSWSARKGKGLYRGGMQPVYNFKKELVQAKVMLNPGEIKYMYNVGNSVDSVLVHELIHVLYKQRIGNVASPKNKAFYGKIANIFASIPKKDLARMEELAKMYRDQTAEFSRLSPRKKHKANMYQTMLSAVSNAKGKQFSHMWEEVIDIALTEPEIMADLYGIRSAKGGLAEKVKSIGRRLIATALEHVAPKMFKIKSQTVMDDFLDLHNEFAESVKKTADTPPIEFESIWQNSLDIRPFKGFPKGASTLAPAIKERNGNIWFSHMGHWDIQDADGNPRIGEEGFVALDKEGRKILEFYDRTTAGAKVDPSKRIIDPDSGKLASEDMKWIALDEKEQSMADVIRRKPDGTKVVVGKTPTKEQVRRRKKMSAEDRAIIDARKKARGGKTLREQWAGVRKENQKRQRAARRKLEPVIEKKKRRPTRWELLRPTDNLVNLSEAKLELEHDRVVSEIDKMQREKRDDSRMVYYTHRLKAINLLFEKAKREELRAQRKYEDEQARKAGHTEKSNLRYYKAEYKRLIRRNAPVNHVNHVRGELVNLMGPGEFYKWSGEEAPVIKQRKAKEAKKVIAEKPASEQVKIKVYEAFTEEDAKKEGTKLKGVNNAQEARDLYDGVMNRLEANYLSQGRTISEDYVEGVTLAIQQALKFKVIDEAQAKSDINKIAAAMTGQDESFDTYGDEQFMSEDHGIQRKLDKWSPIKLHFDAYYSPDDGFVPSGYQFTVMDPNSPAFKASISVAELTESAVKQKVKDTEKLFKGKKKTKWEVEQNEKDNTTHIAQYTGEKDGKPYRVNIELFHSKVSQITRDLVDGDLDRFGGIRYTEITWSVIDRDGNEMFERGEIQADRKMGVGAMKHIQSMLGKLMMGEYKAPIPQAFHFSANKEMDPNKYKIYLIMADRLKKRLGWTIRIDGNHIFVYDHEYKSTGVVDPLKEEMDQVLAELAEEMRVEVEEDGVLNSDDMPDYDNWIDMEQHMAERPVERHVYSDEKMEKTAQIAEKGPRKSTFFTNIKEALESFIGWTREFKYLKRKEYGDIQFALRQLKKAKALAARDAVKAMEKSLADLDKDRFHNLQRLAYLMDLREQVDINEKLDAAGKERDVVANPYNWTDKDIKREAQKALNIVLQDPTTTNAWKMRQDSWFKIRKAYGSAMEAVGYDASSRLKRAFYFRHQVLDFLEGEHRKGLAGSTRLAVPTRRSHLRHRGAKSGYAMNFNYIQAEFEIMAQLLYDTQVAITLNEVMERHGSKEYKEGYELYKPREDAVFYMANTIPGQLLEKALQSGAKEINVPRKQVKQALALGGRYEGWYLPKPVADTLNEALAKKPTPPWLRPLKDLMRAWKAWQLIMPLRILKYNTRNMTGDAEAVFIGSPAVFKWAPRALKELWRWHRAKKNGKPVAAEMQEWFDLGGQEATLQAAELFTIIEKPEFKHLTETKPSLLKRINIPGWIYKKSREYTDLREMWLRYAAYLKFKNDLKKNKGKPKNNNYVASLREEVDALVNINDKAFMMSNDLLGAYDRVGQAGESLRAYVAPFWSFQEVNFKRTAAMFRNALDSDQGMIAVGMKLGAKTPIIALKMGKFATKFMMFSMLTQVWNNMMFGDAEDGLPEDMHRRSHIIIGVTKDGAPEVYYFPRIGVVGDILEWMGADTAPTDAYDLITGKKSFKQIVEYYNEGQNVKDALNKVAQMIGPQYKVPLEAAMGEKFFPSFWNRQPITDRWKYAFDNLALGRVYDGLTGRPTKSDHWLREAKRIGVYYDDQTRLGWLAIQQRKADYKRRAGLGGRGFIVTDSGQALYNFGLAYRYGDEAAMVKYLEKYITVTIAKHGKVNIPRLMEQQWKKLNPLEGLPDTHQKLFLASLDERDQVAFGLAMKYYAEIKSGEQFIRKGGK